MIYYSPKYIEPLFRPPSEGLSMIFQVTIGCSWNRCTFCEMYTSKKYYKRHNADIIEEINKASEFYPQVTKVFLADGDALSLGTKDLLQILQALAQYFPRLRRVSSYVLPRNIAAKSDLELADLAKAGLGLVYLGIESGDDEILQRVKKGETQKSTILALQRLKKAGIKSSVMILNGLGGSTFSSQHAKNSAYVVNETQPEFLSTLVVSFPMGDTRFTKNFGTDFIPLNQKQLFQEMRLFLEHLHLKQTVFRSDHASNYLALKGNLDKDKEKLLALLDKAIWEPETVQLRPEWMRSL